jgi:hypothetical protein
VPLYKLDFDFFQKEIDEIKADGYEIVAHERHFYDRDMGVLARKDGRERYFPLVQTFFDYDDETKEYSNVTFWCAKYKDMVF